MRSHRTLPYSIREVSSVIFSSPGLVHMLCHFSSAKKSLLIIRCLDCLFCLVTCLFSFGYSSGFFFFRLLSVSELMVKILFYLPTFMLSQEVWPDWLWPLVSMVYFWQRLLPCSLFWASYEKWTHYSKHPTAVTVEWKVGWFLSPPLKATCSCPSLLTWGIFFLPV